jgi:hypothetical protein
LTPSRVIAFPFLPGVKVGPFVSVPLMPCPDASAAVVPDVSSKEYAAARAKDGALVKLVVYVCAAAGTVIVCSRVPPSDHEAKVYEVVPTV